MTKFILLLIGLATLLALGALWYRTALRSNIQRQNYDPSRGSGKVEFRGFGSPGSFTPDELRLFRDHGIRIDPRH